MIWVVAGARGVLTGLPTLGSTALSEPPPSLSASLRLLGQPASTTAISLRDQKISWLLRHRGHSCLQPARRMLTLSPDACCQLLPAAVATHALTCMPCSDGCRGDESIEDLLEGNRGIQETVYASLFTLSKGRQSTSLRVVAFRIVVEFLQLFRVGGGAHARGRRTHAGACSSGNMHAPSWSGPCWCAILRPAVPRNAFPPSPLPLLRPLPSTGGV